MSSRALARASCRARPRSTARGLRRRGRRARRGRGGLLLLLLEALLELAVRCLAVGVEHEEAAVVDVGLREAEVEERGCVIWSTSGASGDSVTSCVVGAVGGRVAVSGRSSSGARSSRRKNSAIVWVLARRGGMKHDDLVDVLEVAERVQRELERLAAQQQVALGRGLARVDRALRPQAAER